jgi:hypothetical protein
MSFEFAYCRDWQKVNFVVVVRICGSCFLLVSAYKLVDIISHHHHHWLNSPMWALAFLRTFCQLKYLATPSSDFVSLLQGAVVSPTPNPRLSDVFCQGCLL